MIVKGSGSRKPPRRRSIAGRKFSTTGTIRTAGIGDSVAQSLICGGTIFVFAEKKLDDRDITSIEGTTIIILCAYGYELLHRSYLRADPKI